VNYRSPSSRLDRIKEKWHRNAMRRRKMAAIKPTPPQPKPELKP